MSKHAKRQAVIKKEVEQLEKENITQKEWMYTGEATSKDRPKNSLLQIAEEIDVERSVKPVPIVTEERTKSLEEIIKQRILENNFDDVLRKLPASLTGGKSQPVGDDEDNQEPGMKSQRSLAEIYEQDHLRRMDPENNPTALSVGVQKQHLEIDELWKSLSHQLDSLTSWRFIPTPEVVDTRIVVANIPAVEMEDARPEAEAGQTAMLAPQEVYRPRAKKGEVVLGGVPVARVEMSREEKARNRKREGRRREKKLKVAPVEGGRKDVVDTLKKGGVKIISHNDKGRGGAGRVDGNKRTGGRMAT
jgi:U3 small nucleolar RNA-associated protein MPP10